MIGALKAIRNVVSIVFLVAIVLLSAYAAIIAGAFHPEGFKPESTPENLSAIVRILFVVLVAINHDRIPGFGRRSA